MHYELSDYEWTAIKPMLPNKPRGVPRVNDRSILNGISWVVQVRHGATGLRAMAPAPPATIGFAGVWDQIMDALAAGHDARRCR
jgi:transposase